MSQKLSSHKIIYKTVIKYHYKQGKNQPHLPSVSIHGLNYDSPNWQFCLPSRTCRETHMSWKLQKWEGWGSLVIQEPLLVTLSLQIFYSDCLWSIFWYFLQLLRLLCCLFDIKLQYYGLYLDFRAFVATKKFQYRIYGDIHLSHHLWKHINVCAPFQLLLWCWYYSKAEFYWIDYVRRC